MPDIDALALPETPPAHVGIVQGPVEQLVSRFGRRLYRYIGCPCIEVKEGCAVDSIRVLQRIHDELGIGPWSTGC